MKKTKMEKRFWKAVIAIAVALTFVLPGSAVVANFGMITRDMNKDILEKDMNKDIPISDIISDARSSNTRNKK